MQYPVLRTVQSVLHFTSLTDLFTQTPSWLLWEASSHVLQLMRERCSYTYPPLSIARYSVIQLSELEQCRVKKLSQGFNTTAQNSNPGSRSQVSEYLYRLNLVCKKINKQTTMEIFFVVGRFPQGKQRGLYSRCYHLWPVSGFHGNVTYKVGLSLVSCWNTRRWLTFSGSL